jgi:hypothetical protein
MNARYIGWCGALAAISIPLQAHPGHAPFSEGIKHFLASPAHFVPALGFSVLLCIAAQLLNRRAERAFVRAIAGGIALAALFA